MKKRPLLFLSFSLFIAGVAFFNLNEKQYSPRDSDNPVQGFAGAAEFYNMIKANPETGVFDENLYRKIRTKDEAFRLEKGENTLGLEWDEMGPDNIGGRTRAILIVEDNLMFAGSVSGGLFKSTNQGNTWERVISFDKSYSISTMAVLGNGHIYVGTGTSHEPFVPLGANNASSLIGGGLFVSSDNGDTWDWAMDGNGDPIRPDYGSFGSPTSNDYAIIDKIVADPNQDNKLWVGSNVGLQAYVEGTGFLAFSAGLPETICESIAISSDGMVIAASVGSSNFYLSTDGGQTFEARAGSGTNEMPSNLSRLELAISPDDANYIYGIGATGSGLGHFEGVWGSSNKGATFTKIWQGGVPEIDIDSGQQGNYALAIAVAPESPGVIVVGGLDVWVGGFAVNPEQRSFWGFPVFDTQFPLALDQNAVAIYVHADIHTFAFNSEGTLFIGNDGGISRSEDGANTFVHCNRFYNCTQYYGIGYSGDDKVIGGSQDNGTTYITRTQSTTEEALTVGGGDGFDCDISNLDPSGDVIFTSVYFNSLRRSNDGGNATRQFYSDPAMFNLPAPFHSQARLWEDGNAVTPYTVTYINPNDETIPAGTVLTVDSRSWGYTFQATLSSDLGPFGSVDFADPATTLMAAGFSGTGGVWVTRQATYFDTSPRWGKVRSAVSGDVTALEWSKADGNYLWVGTSSGQLYRISGFANAWTVGQLHVDSADYALSTTSVSLGSAVITDISVDPNDEDHVVVTRGGFGGNAKVLESFNATSGSPVFTDIWFPSSNDLSGLPAYSCVIESGDPNTIIVGTEFGVYATDNGGADWSPESVNPMGPVPVFDIRQQWRDPSLVENAGYIYLGTHGRGAFRSKTYEKASFEEASETANELVGNLLVLPNPMSEYGWLNFDANEKAQVSMDIYGINGQKVKSLKFTMEEGSNHFQFDVSDLGDGTYIIQLKKDDKISTKKFVIIR